ncbi:Gfo/Idh/MocA family protein [Halobacterium salinarum]|uniref:Gfo/Idh/MocA family protein n=1 Tax=Halobacterium salinarum TaxID=2242 RepID=UPI002555066D|nr:Gfo/Idh/MocA family oxidoreductase [Halobacterium salinarum]MDL0141618.1 Gfo/Idh/MocA family oxidoreductase [Halobacterium salinarum]
MSRQQETLNTGVIGTGSMGRHHARVYNELPESNLMGIYDVDDEQAAQVAEENGTEPLGLEELLARVDAVSIAVPTIHHYEIAKQCIEQGVHVLVEKPFVDEQKQGEELIDLAEENDVQIQVGHIERFNPAVVALKDIIPDTDIISVKAERLGPPLDRTMKDSVVKDLMIHDIDILLWLIDESVSSVSALDSDEAYTTANFEFEDGSIGSLTASRVTQRKVRTLTITAHSCRIDVDYIDQSVEIYRHSLPEYIEENGDVRYRHESIVERPMVKNEEPLKSELSSFIDSARSGETPEVSGRDGLRAVKYVNKIEEFANQGNDADE